MVTSELQPLLVLVGPTGIGKTELSLQIAEHFACEIVGVDSMQVYRQMDIGTAKPTAEERLRVPHHLIDYVDPAEEYTAGRFARDAEKAIDSIAAQGRLPLLVGGTGLYLRALLDGIFDEEEGEGGDHSDRAEIRTGLRQRLANEGREVLFRELQETDPATAQRLHPNDSQRLLRALEILLATGIPWSEHLRRQQQREEQAGRDRRRYNVLTLGLHRPRPELYERIDRRVAEMVEQGLLDEVRHLLARGYDGGLKAMQSIGYRHMVYFLEGTWSWQETLELLARDTRRYAKRQLTWFGRDKTIEWFHPERERDTVLQRIGAFLKEPAGTKRP